MRPRRDLRRFDDSDDRITLFEFQFFSTSPRNDGIDDVLADTNRDLCHDVSQSDLANALLKCGMLLVADATRTLREASQGPSTRARPHAF